MATLWGKQYTRGELLRRVGDIRQVASAQAVELADGSERGVREVILRNAAGLDVTVATERGMSITDLRYRGIPIPFTTAVGTVHPAYGDLRGLNWLKSWMAGFLTVCGLSQVGSPCVDNGEELGQHGRAAGIPARNVSWGGEWEEDDYFLYVEGSVRETAMYGLNLVMNRTVWAALDEARFWIEDTVTNHGFAPAPLMLLQHINIGFPLLDASSRLVLPACRSVARDDDAKPGLATCCEFQAPTPGYKEQVFYHYAEPGEGPAEVRLENPAFNQGQGLAMVMRYDPAEYPVLVEWKQMSEGIYVVGLEPANCHVEGRTGERERGTLPMLEPGEERSFNLEIEFRSSM